jgi:hypothetical protein
MPEEVPIELTEEDESPALSQRQEDGTKTLEETKPQRKLGDPVPEHERRPKLALNMSEIKKKELAEAAARRALFRKPTEEMKEVQNTMLRKFLSKFQPKRLPNLQKIAEETKQQLLEMRKDAFQKYTQISANNGKPGMYKPL